jgi:hypothetical protein
LFVIKLGLLQLFLFVESDHLTFKGVAMLFFEDKGVLSSDFLKSGSKYMKLSKTGQE